jgi:bifunctional non-homologous end joining protein LigD
MGGLTLLPRANWKGFLKDAEPTRSAAVCGNEKRLALPVEDHPLDCGEFAGTIPKGEFGGGTVILCDRGRWKPIGDAHKGFAKAHLELKLNGEKPCGRWHLVRMAVKPREKRQSWLLIKGEDEAASAADSPNILEERPELVKTGRLVEQVAGEQPRWSSKTGKIDRSAEAKRASIPVDGSKRKGAKRAALPALPEPALAALIAKPAFNG